MQNITALRARTKGLFLFCIYRHSANAVTEMERSGIEVRSLQLTQTLLQLALPQMHLSLGAIVLYFVFDMMQLH